jgi:excisionase family DNA binding protein
LEKKIKVSENKIEKKLLYTVDEAAKVLNIKLSRMRMAIFRKEISYVKFGALVRLREEDILKFININLIPERAF